jgi:hypothetical protein
MFCHGLGRIFRAKFFSLCDYIKRPQLVAHDDFHLIFVELSYL